MPDPTTTEESTTTAEAASLLVLDMEDAEVLDTTADIPYLVVNAPTKADAQTCARANVPSAYLAAGGITLVIDTIDIEPVNLTTWKIVAHYKLPATAVLSGGGDPTKTFTFDVGQQVQHVTQAISTIATYAKAGYTAPDVQGAIGYDGKKVNGIDVPMAAPTFSETWWFTDVEFSQSYRNTILKLAYKVNNATFRGFSAGEVLFQGATCARRGEELDDPWEVTFKFAVSENRTGITIGAITGIAKKGWEYADVLYAEYEDTAAKAIAPTPLAVYIQQLFYSGTFSSLGIG